MPNISASDLVAIIINLGVAAYLIRYYPRIVARRFQGPPPPFFAWMQRTTPMIGIAVIAATLYHFASRWWG
jgi:hypothetical protein